MTIDKFINNARPIGYIPNKRLKKIFKQYKYIDITEYWFDNEDNPELNTWIDIEGMGYGWLWLDYKNKYSKLRKELIKLATAFHKNEIVWKVQQDDITSYIYNLGYEIVTINLSNKKLHPF